MKNSLTLLLLCLLPLYGFTQETLQEKVLKILNDKTIGEPPVRWQMAYEATHSDYLLLPFEEIMPILNDILLPFAEKELKNQSQRYRAKALLYDQMSVIHINRGETGGR